MYLCILGLENYLLCIPPFPYNGWTFQLKQFTSRNFQTIRPTFKIEPDFFSQILAQQPSSILEHDIKPTTLTCVPHRYMNPRLRGRKLIEQKIMGLWNS